MFQNISEEIEEENIHTEENKKTNWKLIIKNMLKPQRIILYVMTILISTISIMNGQTPFAIAMFAAACSCGTVALPVFIAGIIGTQIGFGGQATLIYILNSLILLGLMFLIKPKVQEETRNEKIKLGIHLMSAVFLVQAAQIFTASFTVQTLLETVLGALVIYIFYKIFVNAIPVIESLGKNDVFTAEEALGASLLMAISICAIGPVLVYGLSIRNILCALIILLLAWRNGALIGTTTGVTLGVVLCMLGFASESLIIIYAISGMITGLLNKTGKFGIVLALVVGFASVTFLNEVAYFNYIREILISAIVLLVLPKNIVINIEDVIGKTKFLPVTKDNRLEENRNAVLKLNSVSETINEIAKSYEEAAATLVEDQEEFLEKNKLIFIEELTTNLESISENMLYEDLIETNNGIAGDIFDFLVKNEEMEIKDLLNIFEKHNSYILGINDKNMKRQIEKQVYEAVKNINYIYQASKLNFIWKKKVAENNKNVSNQFKNVSKAIKDVAKNINQNENKKENKPNFRLNIGISKTTKNESTISGDSSTQLKLKDGKYLLAISDGMGTGKKAKNSSKKAIRMLENLLLAGFQKDESIKLINSTLCTNIDDEMYATFDISVIDLETGNIEFVKSGACPTYIKTGNKIQVVDETSTPAGMLDNMDLITYDTDLKDGDIVVMCTDGILDASGKHKEEWLKQILLQIKTKDVQKIADLIIREAIDEGLGIARDDMTIIVARIEKI